MKSSLTVPIFMLVLVAISLSECSSSSNLIVWHRFKHHYGKIYSSPEEEIMRYAIFVANKEHIERHNTATSAGYKLALNHMSDWTTEEFNRLNGYKQTQSARHNALDRSDEFLRTYLESDRPIPTEVDWRKVPGRVSRVKDQGHCGSCWAFATTGLLEGQEIPGNISKQLIELSEQQLVDCSLSYPGCRGGDVSSALDYVADNGIEAEADYPYKGGDQQCSYSKSKVALTIDGARFPQQWDEDALTKLVATYGPVAVGIEATTTLKHYKSGVLNDTTCTDIMNHAVLIVGYGVDPKVGNYWLLKNSWGHEWGDQGYFKYVRGVNMCGISEAPVIVALK